MKKYIEPKMAITEFSYENIVTDSAVITSALANYADGGIKLQQRSYKEIFAKNE